MKQDQLKNVVRGSVSLNRRVIGTLMIAGLIVMAVFAGTAAANGVAHIYGSRYNWDYEQQPNFETTDNLYAHGCFGFYSDPPGNPCPDGCGGRVYVVKHKETWTNGDPLNDVSSDGYETIAWDNSFFDLIWPTPLTPGTYDLILDLNVSGTENYYVWTDIADPANPGGYDLTDPIWTITVIGDEPEPIPEFSTIAIPVAGILGLLFFYNYRKHRGKE